MGTTSPSCKNSEFLSIKFTSATALQIELVLENIFGYLSFPDLKNCSEVNRIWRKNSALLLAEKSLPLRLMSKHVLIFKESKVSSCRKECALSFTKLINASNGIFPCSKFIVDLDDTSDIESIYLPFFQSIAPFATEVAICCYHSSRYHNNGYDQQKLISNLEYPKLKSIQLDKEKNIKFALGTFISDLFAAIIQQAPKLHKVSLSIRECNAELVDVLIKALDSHPGRQISHLKLEGDISNQLFIQLGNIRLKLQTCELNFLDLELDWHKNLQLFLETQANTLKFLFLKNLKKLGNGSQGISFPRMSNLNSLKIYSTYQLDNCQPLASVLRHPNQFPNLKRLSITHFAQALETLVNPIRARFEQLETVELLSMLGSDISWTKHVSELFSTVKNVVIFSAESNFQSLQQVFANVEKLTINVGDHDSRREWKGCYSATMALTGYTTPELEMRAAQAPRWQQVFLRKLEESSRNKFLHKLHVIKLVEKDFKWTKGLVVFRKSPNPTLTDLACRLVLLKLQSLKCLDLRQCCSIQISKQMLGEMRRKFVVLCKDEKVICGE